MNRTALFKQYLTDPEILTIPMAHDPLRAKIIELASKYWAATIPRYAGLAAATSRSPPMPLTATRESRVLAPTHKAWRRRESESNGRRLGRK
jgi:hypothetical protein